MELLAKLFLGLLVCLESQLLPDEVKVFRARPPGQLVVEIGKLVLKLQFERLHHLLHFYDFGLAVEHSFNLLSTHFLVQCAHSELLVHFALHTAVEFF